MEPPQIRKLYKFEINSIIPDLPDDILYNWKEYEYFYKLRLLIKDSINLTIDLIPINFAHHAFRCLYKKDFHRNKDKITEIYCNPLSDESLRFNDKIYELYFEASDLQINIGSIQYSEIHNKWLKSSHNNFKAWVLSKYKSLSQIYQQKKFYDNLIIFYPQLTDMWALGLSKLNINVINIPQLMIALDQEFQTSIDVLKQRATASFMNSSILNAFHNNQPVYWYLHHNPRLDLSFRSILDVFHQI